MSALLIMTSLVRELGVGAIGRRELGVARWRGVDTGQRNPYNRFEVVHTITHGGA